MRCTSWLVLAALAGSAAAQSIAVYDLSYTTALDYQTQYEHQHTVAALAGLVNRDGPNLFTPLLVPGSGVDGGSVADQLWRETLVGPGQWLHNATWHNLSSLEDLIGAFGSSIRGVVLYDPMVPATAALAATAAGVEGLLPVCSSTQPNSVYARLVLSGPRLPVTLNLTGQFRAADPSPKIAAYRWARNRWLVPGGCNPAKFGYYVDYYAALKGAGLGAAPGLSQVSNIDYFVSQKAFFFDLSVWADELPLDDPTQPLGADRAEMTAIFATAYALTRGSNYTGERMLHVGGFTPWWFKYTSDGPGCPSCKHKGVETEWETMALIGAYNAFDDGDACCVGTFPNAAFYQHAPVGQLKQNPKPTVADLQARGLVDGDLKVKPLAYAMYYAGDYDGAAWLYSQWRTNWDHPARGQVPIGWAIDSELSLRFPPAFGYAYATKSANDWFISGDSGAGYLNPTLLFPDPSTGKRGTSNVSESGAPDWVAWNQKWYAQFDLSFTGFLINGDAGVLSPEALGMYRSFSGDGVVVTTAHDPSRGSKVQGAAWVDAEGTPVMHHVTDLPGGDAKAAAEIVTGIVNAGDASKAQFYVLRCILQTAGFMADTAAQAKARLPRIEFVDPYTMGLLVKLAGNSSLPDPLV